MPWEVRKEVFMAYDFLHAALRISSILRIFSLHLVQNHVQLMSTRSQ